MSTTVLYNDFLSPNGALTAQGGPWRFEGSSQDIMCWSTRTPFCNDYGQCIVCQFAASADPPPYRTKYLVNISVPMAQYGNANTLDYTFAYNLNWAAHETPAGSPLSSVVTVGSSRDTDNFGASDASSLLQSPTSSSLGRSFFLLYEPLEKLKDPFAGAPFTHSGTTSVLKSPDGNMGYVPITIDFAFNRINGPDCNWYMKGAAFRITTLPSSSTRSASSVSGSASSLSASSSPSLSLTGTVSGSIVALSGVPVPSISQDSNSIGGGGTDPGRLDPSPTRRRLPIGIIIGAVIGGIALLCLFTVLLSLIYKKKLRELKRRDQELLMGHTGSNTNGESNNNNGDGDLTMVPMTAVNSDPFGTYPPPLVSSIGHTTSSVENLDTKPVITARSSTLFDSVDASSADRDSSAQQDEEAVGPGVQVGGQQPPLRPISSGTVFSNMGAPPPAYSAVVNGLTNDRGYEEEDEEDSDDDDEDQNGLTSPSQFEDDSSSSQVDSNARGVDGGDMSSSPEGTVVGVRRKVSHQAGRR
ncbi:hypothetical protein FRC17_004313 [Serendipita sp. 399]|nr:hypothetical protein FRC17_004313 [Serendipita sp. 399]